MPDSAVTVRDLDAADRPWAEQVVDEAFGSRFQARRGALVDVLSLRLLVAERDGQRIGLLAFDEDAGGEAELAVLATPVRGAGAGTALVRALRARVPTRPIWVVTTNDNVDALRFYQQHGFRLREVRAGAVDDARRRSKPSIPAVGRHGIPIRDEIELVLDDPSTAEPSDDAPTARRRRAAGGPPNG